MLVFVLLFLLLIIFNNNFYLFGFVYEELVFGEFVNYVNINIKWLGMCLVWFGFLY